MNMPNVLCLVVGLLAFVVAIWQIAAFASATRNQDMWEGTSHLVFGLVALVIACVCAVYYFVRNKKEVEEIHITDRG